MGAAPSPPAAARPLLASSRDSSIPRASALLFFALLIFLNHFSPRILGKRGKTPASPAGRKEPVLPRTHTAAPAGAGLRPVERVGKVKVGQVGSPGQKRGCPCKRGEPQQKGGAPGEPGSPLGAAGAGRSRGRAAAVQSRPPHVSIRGGSGSCRVCSRVLGSDTAVPPRLGSGRRAVGPALRPAGTPFASHHPAVVFYRPEAAGPQDRVRVDV